VTGRGWRLSRDHAAETPSSRFATPTLGLGAFGVTASRRCGYLPPCLFGARCGPQGRYRSPKRHGGQTPSPRGAVKVREAGECSCIRLGEATAEGGLTFTASTTMAARRLAFWRRGGTAWVAGTSPAMTAGTPMASRQARSFARHINACTYRHMTFPRNVPPSPCFLRDFRGDPPPFSRGAARFRARGRSTRRLLRSFSGPHDGLRRHDGRRSGKSVGPPNNIFLKYGIYARNSHLKSRTKVPP
jgi:hypothetical protein